jgi:hypothetical protein
MNQEDQLAYHLDRRRAINNRIDVTRARFRKLCDNPDANPEAKRAVREELDSLHQSLEDTLARIDACDY